MNEEIIQIKNFLGHVQGRVGQAAFAEICRTVESLEKEVKNKLYTGEELEAICNDVMNLGMGLRQDQLNGKSGNEVLDEYFKSLKHRKAIEEGMQYTLSEYKTMEELFDRAELDEHSLYFIEAKTSQHNVKHYSVLFTGYKHGSYCEVYNNSYRSPVGLDSIHSFNIIKKLHTNEYKNI